jgi:hypothetical protein
MDEEGEILTNQALPESMKIDIIGILSQVHLSDKPIILLFVFHILLFIAGLAARGNRFWRVIVFLVCMSISLAVEKIGAFLAARWQEFGFSANYFDENGVFLLFFFALPPIITCILLFSHLVGSIFGRLIDGYFFAARPPKVTESAPKGDEADTKAKAE